VQPGLEIGLLRVRGPDARSFLQNQLSNDLRQVSPKQGQLAGYLSPKGRLLAVVVVQQIGEDDFLLRLPASLLPATLKRLRMFVLRSAVQLSDASAEFVTLGLLGTAATAALASLDCMAPDTEYGTVCGPGGWLLRCPGPLPRFELTATPEALAAWGPKLALPTLPASAWALAALASGTPVIAPETIDAFVPQTADLDLAGGISFTKGCYPGQEIVARVHYLGRAKQRLFFGATDTPPQPGSAVVDAAGQPAGTVMASAPLPGQGALLLAVLPLAPQSPLQWAGGGTIHSLARVHTDPAVAEG